nr:uncharacterized protein LOC129257463 [Lytechinus pictus]
MEQENEVGQFNLTVQGTTEEENKSDTANENDQCETTVHPGPSEGTKDTCIGDPDDVHAAQGSMEDLTNQNVPGNTEGSVDGVNKVGIEIPVDLEDHSSLEPVGVVSGASTADVTTEVNDSETHPEGNTPSMSTEEQTITHEDADRLDPGENLTELAASGTTVSADEVVVSLQEVNKDPISSSTDDRKSEISVQDSRDSAEECNQTEGIVQIDSQLSKELITQSVDQTGASAEQGDNALCRGSPGVVQVIGASDTGEDGEESAELSASSSEESCSNKFVGTFSGDHNIPSHAKSVHEDNMLVNTSAVDITSDEAVPSMPIDSMTTCENASVSDMSWTEAEIAMTKKQDEDTITSTVQEVYQQDSDHTDLAQISPVDTNVLDKTRNVLGNESSDFVTSTSTQEERGSNMSDGTLMKISIDANQINEATPRDSIHVVDDDRGQMVMELSTDVIQPNQSSAHGPGQQLTQLIKPMVLSEEPMDVTESALHISSSQTVVDTIDPSVVPCIASEMLGKDSEAHASHHLSSVTSSDAVESQESGPDMEEERLEESSKNLEEIVQDEGVVITTADYQKPSIESGGVVTSDVLISYDEMGLTGQVSEMEIDQHDQRDDDKSESRILSQENIANASVVEASSCSGTSLASEEEQEQGEKDQSEDKEMEEHVHPVPTTHCTIKPDSQASDVKDKDIALLEPSSAEAKTYSCDTTTADSGSASEIEQPLQKELIEECQSSGTDPLKDLTESFDENEQTQQTPINPAVKPLAMSSGQMDLPHDQDTCDSDDRTILDQSAHDGDSLTEEAKPSNICDVKKMHGNNASTSMQFEHLEDDEQRLVEDGNRLAGERVADKVGSGYTEDENRIELPAPLDQKEKMAVESCDGDTAECSKRTSHVPDSENSNAESSEVQGEQLTESHCIQTAVGDVDSDDEQMTPEIILEKGELSGDVKGELGKNISSLQEEVTSRSDSGPVAGNSEVTVGSISEDNPVSIEISSETDIVHDIEQVRNLDNPVSSESIQENIELENDEIDETVSEEAQVSSKNETSACQQLISQESTTDARLMHAPRDNSHINDPSQSCTEAIVESSSREISESSYEESRTEANVMHPSLDDGDTFYPSQSSKEAALESSKVISESDFEGESETTLNDTECKSSKTIDEKSGELPSGHLQETISVEVRPGELESHQKDDSQLEEIPMVVDKCEDIEASDAADNESKSSAKMKSDIPEDMEVFPAENSLGKDIEEITDEAETKSTGVSEIEPVSDIAENKDHLLTCSAEGFDHVKDVEEFTEIAEKHTTCSTESDAADISNTRGSEIESVSHISEELVDNKPSCTSSVEALYPSSDTKEISEVAETKTIGVFDVTDNENECSTEMEYVHNIPEEIEDNEASHTLFAETLDPSKEIIDVVEADKINTTEVSVIDIPEEVVDKEPSYTPAGEPDCSKDPEVIAVTSTAGVSESVSNIPEKTEESKSSHSLIFAEVLDPSKKIKELSHATETITTGVSYVTDNDNKCMAEIEPVSDIPEEIVNKEPSCTPSAEILDPGKDTEVISKIEENTGVSESVGSENAFMGTTLTDSAVLSVKMDGSEDDTSVDSSRGMEMEISVIDDVVTPHSKEEEIVLQRSEAIEISTIMSKKLLNEEVSTHQSVSFEPGDITANTTNMEGKEAIHDVDKNLEISDAATEFASQENNDRADMIKDVSGEEIGSGITVHSEPSNIDSYVEASDLETENMHSIEEDGAGELIPIAADLTAVDVTSVPDELQEVSSRELGNICQDVGLSDLNLKQSDETMDVDEAMEIDDEQEIQESNEESRVESTSSDSSGCVVEQASFEEQRHVECSREKESEISKDHDSSEMVTGVLENKEVSSMNNYEEPIQGLSVDENQDSNAIESTVLSDSYTDHKDTIAAESVLESLPERSESTFEDGKSTASENVDEEVLPVKDTEGVDSVQVGDDDSVIIPDGVTDQKETVREESIHQSDERQPSSGEVLQLKDSQPETSMDSQDVRIDSTPNETQEGQKVDQMSRESDSSEKCEREDDAVPIEERVQTVRKEMEEVSKVISKISDQLVEKIDEEDMEIPVLERSLSAGEVPVLEGENLAEIDAPILTLATSKEVQDDKDTPDSGDTNQVDNASSLNVNEPENAPQERKGIPSKEFDDITHATKQADSKVERVYDDDDALSDQEDGKLMIDEGSAEDNDIIVLDDSEMCKDVNDFRVKESAPELVPSDVNVEAADDTSRGSADVSTHKLEDENKMDTLSQSLTIQTKDPQQSIAQLAVTAQPADEETANMILQEILKMSETIGEGVVAIPVTTPEGEILKVPLTVDQTGVSSCVDDGEKAINEEVQVVVEEKVMAPEMDHVPEENGAEGEMGDTSDHHLQSQDNFDEAEVRALESEENQSSPVSEARKAKKRIFSKTCRTGKCSCKHCLEAKRAKQAPPEPTPDESSKAKRKPLPTKFKKLAITFAPTMKKVKCSSCILEFETEQDMQAHFKSTHANQPKMCSICQQSFQNEELVKLHELSHVKSGMFICLVCDKSYKRKADIVRHYKSHKDPVPSSVKRKSSTEISIVVDDSMEAKPIQPGKIRKLAVVEDTKKEKSAVCPKESERGAEMKANSNSVHAKGPVKTPLQKVKVEIKSEDKPKTASASAGGPSKNKQTPVKPKTDLFSCKLCGKDFVHEELLEEHKKIHTGEFPFPCSMCDKAFKVANQLKKHERVHTGEKPYMCQYCNKRFYSSSNKKRHERTHTGYKPYVCSVCDKPLSEKWILKKHEKMHLSIGGISFDD